MEEAYLRMAAQEPDSHSKIGGGRPISCIKANARPDLRLESGFVRWSVEGKEISVPLSNVRSVTTAATPEPVDYPPPRDEETSALAQKVAGDMLEAIETGFKPPPGLDELNPYERLKVEHRRELVSQIVSYMKSKGYTADDMDLSNLESKAVRDAVTAATQPEAPKLEVVSEGEPTPLPPKKPVRRKTTKKRVAKKTRKKR